jgi:flagellar biosynthesis/type III secretory pathway protein FliH
METSKGQAPEQSAGLLPSDAYQRGFQQGFTGGYQQGYQQGYNDALSKME